MWTQDCLLLSEKEKPGRVEEMMNEERERERETENENINGKGNDPLMKSVKVDMPSGTPGAEETNNATNERSSFIFNTIPRNEKSESLTKPKTGRESGEAIQPKKLETGEEIISQIIAIHHSLKTLEAISLEPCPEINELFGRLVGISILPVREVVAERVSFFSFLSEMCVFLVSVC